MSDSKANDIRKILDNGHAVLLVRNDLGSYTASVVAVGECVLERCDENAITDDFTPADALYRLAEKFTTGRIA